MDIVVCLKRTPDTAARIQIATSGLAIDLANVAFEIGPYDQFALEEALRLKDAHGATVTVISLGPAEVAKELRDALSRGADKAILLKADGSATDAYGVATALADAVRPLSADLVMFGYKASDDDGAQVGSIVATKLGMPVVTEVTEIALAGRALTLVRESEGGQERVTCALPAAITVHKTPHELRISNIKGIMAAKKKPLDERAVTLAPSRVKIRNLTPPPERKAGRRVEGADAVAVTVRYLKDELKLL